MTQERFFQLVDDPELLRRITYEELKTLALAYPYAHNLRCLLAIKAGQIEHPDAQRNLATAATYSLDRTRLFMLAAPQMIAPQQILAPEEVLELKPIETVKRELEALSPIVREEKGEEQIATAAPIPPATPRAEPEPTPAPVPEPEPAPVPDLEPEPVPEPSLEPEPVPEPNLEPEPVPEPVLEPEPAPMPVYQEFSAWISAFQPPALKKSERKKATPTVAQTIAPVLVQTEPNTTELEEESPKNQGIAQQLAEKSVAENQDVVSETLAKLYAKQGYRDKAAQMYARLALLFPEKSPYFAAEIEKLKK
ncbi:MAG TPA: hypothetical protein VK168_11780 [Saprospiraceae bacterium]|nr:hypothetical protein [Saprospiraceae bacterium]